MSYPPLEMMVETPDGAVRNVSLAGDIIKVGSLASAHLRLEGDGVSRLHAVIERTPLGPVIIDLGSTTGTLVNGEKVNKVTLGGGDRIHIGGHQIQMLSLRPTKQPRPALGRAEKANGPACPRCRGEVVKAEWTTGAGYREAHATFSFLRCHGCAVSLLRGEAIRSRYGRDDDRLGGTILERDRRSSEQSCPDCFATLDRLTLVWGALWVELEECASCGAVVLDDGEGSLLDQLLASAGNT